TQPNVLAATTTQTNVSCFNGTNGSATVTPTGGTGAYSYSWNTVPVQTSATANGLAVGTYIVTITDANSCLTTKSVTITQPNVLAATTAQTNVSCFNGTNGTATITPTGGTGSYSYSWNTVPVNTSATANGLSAGTYIVTITDANSCSITKSVTITQPNVLAATTTQNNVSCFNGTNGSATVIPAGGTGAYSYSWNTVPVQTTATATGLAAGTYIVTITDANSCSITKSVTITQPNILAATTTQTNVSCFNGTNGSATVTPTGGTGTYSYSWNTVPVQTSATATGLSAGTYVVTITDANSCSIIKSVTITQPNVLAATTTQTNVSCFNGTNGSATVTPTGGTGTYSYSWTTVPVQTSATATGLAAGTYIVTITDANSCSTTKSVTITQPNVLTATTTQTNVSCFNGTNGSATVTPTGGTGTYSYSWNTTPAQETSTVTGLAAGSYTVTVTDANGCLITETITITQPNVLTATTTQTNVSCFNGTNGSATVTPTGGTGTYSYSWNTTPAQETSTATGLEAGSYTVVVTDDNGCSITETITITQPEVLATITAQTNVSCFNGTNGSATVTPTGGTGTYSYSWNTTPVQETATATGLAAGSYTVVVTDDNGCSITETIAITQPEVLATTMAQTNVSCFNGTNGSATVTPTGGTGAYTYSWSTVPEQTTATATGLAAGLYIVTVTDANGCTATVNFTITQPPAIIIGTQPEDSIVTVGDNTTFIIAAENADTYQWQLSTNGTDWNDITDGGTSPAYSGASTNTLSLAGIPLVNDGDLYRLILVNGADCATISSTAMLTVINGLEAVDDDFSATIINEGVGGIAGDLTLNDMFNSAPVNDNDVIITIINNGGLAGLTVSANGIASVTGTATAGTYTVTYSICDAVNATNCDTAEATIVVAPPLKTEGFDITKIDVYPNPATTEVFIKIPTFGSQKNLKVTVFDIHGRLIKEQLLNAEIEKVNISTLEDGVYIFNISCDGGSISKKIIKRP
ncbi:T9SS type A sorting domain-containing protein, partial [Flavobacterium sp. DGU11]